MIRMQVTGWERDAFNLPEASGPPHSMGGSWHSRFHQVPPQQIRSPRTRHKPHSQDPGVQGAVV